MPLIHKYKHILLSPVGLSLSFLFIGGLVPNNKIFFILATLYFFLLLYTQKSMHKALIYAYFPFLLLNTGQTYTIPIIPSLNMTTYDPAYINGKQMIILFTPLTILLICSAVYLPFIIARKKSHIKSLLFVCLAFYSIIMLLSSYWSNTFPTFAILFSLERIGTIIWAMVFMLSDKNDTQEIIQNILLILIGITIFEGLIVLYQTVTQHSIGLFYENNPFIPQASDDLDATRPVGLHLHPNSLAVTYVEYFYIFTIYTFHSNNIKSVQKTLIIGILTSLAIIALSRSRTAYLAIILPLIYLYFQDKLFYKKLTVYTVSFIKKYHFLKIFIYIMSAYSVIIILLRMLFSENTFSEWGAFAGRSKLITIAVSLIKQYPLFGTGTNMFIPSAYYLFPIGIMQIFPEAVHNGFLLILAENGIFAFIFFLLIYSCYLLFIKNVHYTNGIHKATMTSGIIGLFVLMLFQQYVPIVPLMMVMIFSEFD
jgi:hypothetical protein